MGGGPKGDGKKARAGLVRAIMAHKDKALNPKHEILNGRKEVAGQWQRLSREYRMILLEEGEEKVKEVVNPAGKLEVKVVRKGMKKEAVDAEMDRLQRSRDVAIGKMLRCRVRYFTDGAVIGSRAFVNEAFARARERFGKSRKDGARPLRGVAASAKGVLWSARDLRLGVDGT